ncbi:amidase [Hoyosella sp. YIM 151337]|uniref:amidase n=1 Tax=Hoyosella sp. YIM 151337 TaxID=2992742 RepID=UPI0022355F05|nr:amidase [Hoyosella sp. YIM 151337]MCW4352220.1 amidase [Hoyosella sp. YIM 151337]
MTRVHAFADDALGDDDAVGLAERLAAGEVSAAELASAAVARAGRVDAQLRAIAVPYDQPRYASDATGALAGVPTYVKDNVDLAGLPTQNGSSAYTASPATRDGNFAKQFLATGVTVLGKTRLPEFGLNASTEYSADEPCRNPWHTDFSVGASSGGAAALVAAGVVPIAHANDGGGSIRIPAACTGLVGLKPTLGRLVDSEATRFMPVNIVSEGVVTRTVRDTAAFLAAAERYRRNPRLAPIGRVLGPAQRTLRIGIQLESPTGATIDAETRAAVERTATALERAGHIIEQADIPVTTEFVDDFVRYWGLLADLATTTGKVALHRSWNSSRADGLTRGLRDHHRRSLHRIPTSLKRLHAVRHAYAESFTRHDVVLSPVLSHLTPRLGHLSPTVPFDELIDRLITYVSFTPLHNVAGAPAISLPAGLSTDGLPVGVQLSTARGDERTLLELAYLLEAEQPFPTIHDRERSKVG